MKENISASLKTLILKVNPAADPGRPLAAQLQSLDMFIFIAEVERQFRIHVADTDLAAGLLNTLEQWTAYVEARRSGPS
jgi:acyl carrier protein